MLTSVVRYTEDAAGLEKTLRLFQALFTVASGLAVDPTPFLVARAQVNLGRRYFRLLKWHPCWANAYSSFTASQSGSVKTILEAIKWSLLGMYFFLEAFTITNAMGVTTFEWGPRLQHEANKFWFYALATSIVVSLFELLFSPSLKAVAAGSIDESTEVKKDSAKQAEKATPPEVQKPIPSQPVKQKVYTQLAIDACDLFIPGSAIGWIPAGLVVVGTATTISTVLAGQQVWQRVQLKKKSE